MRESGKPERVAVVGASANPERYSNRAIRMLREAGHEVVPVHPAMEEVGGLKVARGLGGIEGGVDTVTMYVNPEVGEGMIEELLTLKPRRVILNPGTESDLISDRLEEEGIEVIDACTLVLLRTGQF